MVVLLLSGYCWHFERPGLASTLCLCVVAGSLLLFCFLWYTAKRAEAEMLCMNKVYHYLNNRGKWRAKLKIKLDIQEVRSLLGPKMIFK